MTEEKPKVDPGDRAAFEARAERDLAESAPVAADPVAALGFDVTDLSPAEFQERGITLSPDPRREDVGLGGSVWLTHSEVASRYRSRDNIDRALARQAAGHHWARHGTLKGLRLHRTFPCLGKYRVQNVGAETGPMIVVCEVCGDTFGVRRDEFQAALDATLV